MKGDPENTQYRAHFARIPYMQKLDAIKLSHGHNFFNYVTQFEEILNV